MTSSHKKNVLITGATGMVGGEALRICLASPEVSHVTVIGRRPTGVVHEKLREIIHDDFMDFSKIAEVFTHQDAALFCLGAYTGSVPDDLFKKISVDFTLAFARALYEKSPEATFCLLSGQGADSLEKSRIAFARYKGMAENGIFEMGFPRVCIFRPGYIYPVVPRKEPNLMYRMFRPLYPVIRKVYPNMGIASDRLATAMVRAGLDEMGRGTRLVLENRDIRSFSSAHMIRTAQKPSTDS